MARILFQNKEEALKWYISKNISKYLYNKENPTGIAVKTDALFEAFHKELHLTPGDFYFVNSGE